LISPQSPPGRTVLLVAFHFPPVRGSSGVQRTLRFAQHLPAYGWRPVVLTIDPRAYESVGHAAGNEIPAGLLVERAFGLDAARQLSLFGRYPSWLALPDRWATWRRWAVRRAAQLIRRERVAAVWSTFPIATAHAIGLDVARAHGLPWIAEFRDPMWQGDYPPDPAMNRAWRELETRIFERANRVVVTTPSAVDVYAERFPAFERSRIQLIENGYDEETFERAGGRPHAGPMPGRPVTLLHSGIVYRSERDPTQFFDAIARLKSKGAISASSLQVILRATANDEAYRRDLNRLGIEDIVRLEPPVDYLAALEEMLSVDGLLLLQASNCNAQIPAKLYEYLRAERPILALTDPAGDTARTLDAAGAGLVARLDSTDEIEAAIPAFMEQVRRGTWRRASAEAVRRCSRAAQAGQLAQVLDAVT
jgi:glycosyltransferase involved in cell wall biosynthesis